MRIGITYNLRKDFTPRPGAPEDAGEEFDHPETLEALRKVIAKAGHEVFLLGGDLGILEKIKQHRIEFVFNLAEGQHGRSREAHVPALLEMAGVPYSGSDPLALSLTLDKALTKRVALSLDIRTPQFWVLERPEDLAAVPPYFPLFLKPLWQGSSIGVRASSKVENEADFVDEANRLWENYGEPILAEEYIRGREFTAGVLGGPEPRVLGIMEMTFKDPKKKDFYYGLETKRNWKKEVDYHAPAFLDPAAESDIRTAAVLLFKTLGLRDVARFDFRMDGCGRVYFLEVNPLPGLSPESGDLVILAGKMGVSFEELVLTILQSALSRMKPPMVPGTVGTR